MKTIIAMSILIMSQYMSFAQTVKKEGPLDKIIRRVLLEEKLAKKKYNYKLKFDEELNPYIHVNFTNDLEHKDITTIEFEYRYSIDERGYINNIYSKKLIKFSATSNIKINFTNEDLKGYQRPSDIKLNGVSVKTIRFKDGSVYGKLVHIYSMDNI